MYKTLNDRVISWADRVGILERGEAKAQFLMVSEECGEFFEAWLGNDIEEYKDGLGDFQVTLIVICKLLGLSWIDIYEDCKNTLSEDDLGAFKTAVFALRIQNSVSHLAKGITKKRGEFIFKSICKIAKLLLMFEYEKQIEDSLELALGVIEGRTGEMVNGSFVKKEDLL